MSTSTTRPTPPPPPPPPPVVVGKHRSSIIIAISYLTVLLVPWILTALLSRRPIFSGPTTYEYNPDTRTAQRQFSDYDAIRVNQTMAAIRVLNWVAALASMPALYALLARAAVVYSQRTACSKGQSLNVLQLFSLADGRFLGDVHRSREGGRTGLGVVAAGVVLFALITLPLQGILVDVQVGQAALHKSSKATTATAYGTGRFVTAGPNDWKAEIIGQDPPLASIARHPYRDEVLARTRNALSSFDLNTMFNHPRYGVWRDPDTGDEFASSLPPLTHTGLYRHHAVRMNSSVGCEGVIDEGGVEEMLDRCRGAAAAEDDTRNIFEWTWKQGGGLEVTICAPHDMTKTFLGPGTNVNTPKKRRDFREEFYLSVVVDNSTAEETATGLASAQVRCETRSTLGYFELGNYHNDGVFSGLLDEAPTGEEASNAGFIEHLYDDQIFDRPPSNTGTRGDPGPETDPATPGPLGVFLLSLFGPNSTYTALRDMQNTTTSSSNTSSTRQLSTCHLARESMPFRSTQVRNAYNTRYYSGEPFDPCLSPPGTDTDIITNNPPPTSSSTAPPPPNWPTKILAEFIRPFTDHADRPTFGDPLDLASQMLSAGLHLANQASLDVAASWRADHDGEIGGPWVIYNTPLTVAYARPKISLPALIAISVLLAVQAVGVVWLVCYIWSVPVWTETLDAFAIARLAYRIKDDGYIAGFGLRVPALERVGRKGDREVMLDRLGRVDALVGVVDGGEDGDEDVEMGDLSSQRSLRREGNGDDNAGGGGGVQHGEPLMGGGDPPAYDKIGSAPVLDVGGRGAITNALVRRKSRS